MLGLDLLVSRRDEVSHGLAVLVVDTPDFLQAGMVIFSSSDSFILGV